MLSSIIGDEFLTKMVHKAGLRAKVLRSGDVKIGDIIKYH
jgi:MOSC domain-containing protein YiiM